MIFLILNFRLCAGYSSEEIRSLVLPVPPLHLFKQDRGQKEMFCQCHWNTISTQKEIQLFRCWDKDVCSDKGNNERTPQCECSGQYFQHQICQLAAIQNMTNRPWLRQPYNGLLVLVIKCFHLVQKFQIFLSHHSFHRIYGQRPLLGGGVVKMLLLTIIRLWSFIFMWIDIRMTAPEESAELTNTNC